MAVYDFLNNIPVGAWVQGTMATIDYYKQRINTDVLNHDIFTTKIPAMKDARFSSWYMGRAQSNIYAAAQKYFVENIPSTVPNTYVKLNSSGGMIRDQNFNTIFYDLTGKKVVAYMDIVPLSQILVDMRQPTYKFCYLNPVFGSMVSQAIRDPLDGANLGWGYGSCFLLCPELENDRENIAPALKEYNGDISGFVTVKDIRYYAVDKDGNRERLQYFMPTMPLIISGKTLCEDIGTFLQNNSSGSVYKKLTISEPYGLIQICLPADGVTRTPNPYPFQTGQGTDFSPGNRGYRCFGYTNSNLPIWLNDFYSITGENEIEVNIVGERNNAYYNIDLDGAVPRFSPWGKVHYMGIFAPNATHTTRYRFIDGNLFMYGGSNSGLYSGVAYAQDKQAFFDIFEDWGIYCTDNLDEALYGEIPDIIPQNPAGGNSGTDPELPDNGITDNEIPENIPKDDDNIIDDFVVETPNLTATNLCRSYVYNFNQVQSLFNWFCSKGYIENQSELFADKLSAIYGLMMFPFDLVQHDSAHTEATSTTTIVSVSEDIAGYILKDGYNTIVSGGYIEYLSYYGNFADWTHCKYTVYVPFGGVIDLPPSAVVNKRLTLDYCVDLLTGKATAVIKSYALGNDDLGVLIKLIPCQLGQLVPVQSSNFAQREISNTLTAVSMGATGVGMAASVAGSAAIGNPMGIINGALSGISSLVQQGVKSHFSQQLTYAATGALTPSTGFSLAQTAYLSISRARLVKPSNYKEMDGLPTSYFTTLESVSTGNNFIQCDNIQLDIPSANDNECAEIRALLSSGVYI